jgi:hypothetical protein
VLRLHKLDHWREDQVLTFSHINKFFSEIVVMFQEIVDEATRICLRQRQWRSRSHFHSDSLPLFLSHSHIRSQLGLGCVDDVNEFCDEVALVVDALDCALNNELLSDFKTKLYFFSNSLLHYLWDHVVLLIEVDNILAVHQVHID